MKIYFGSSITYGRKYLKNARLIVETIESLGHQVVSKHVVDPKLKPGNGLGPKSLFRGEMKKVDKADLMIAEVTQPSWGTAFLIEHALGREKPVLAVFYKDNGIDLPMMIDGHPDLYKEYYTEDTLKNILRKFFEFFEVKEKNQKGNLVVIEGLDGSGKETQSKLLHQFLQKNNYKSKKIDFPRYYTSFHGKVVGRFLKGDFGPLAKVDPYLVSYVYALDRMAAKDDLLDWLGGGNIVIANRYVPSGFTFQAVRAPTRKQDDFIKWLYELEYKQNRLPKEDIVIFLHVPVGVSQKLLTKKSKSKSRRYTGGKEKDINEESVKYQKQVQQMYLKLSKKYKHWHLIDCVDKSGKILKKSEIHKKITALLKSKKII